MIRSSPTFHFASMAAGERHCVDLSALDDTLFEGTEQFELYFELINPSGYATEGDPATVCVNITDNEGMHCVYYLHGDIIVHAMRSNLRQAYIVMIHTSY